MQLRELKWLKKLRFPYSYLNSKEKVRKITSFVSIDSNPPTCLPIKIKKTSHSQRKMTIGKLVANWEGS